MYECLLYLYINVDITSSPSSIQGPIWLDNLNCPASAEIIEDCSHPGFGVHNCRHRDDVGVICNPGDYNYIVRGYHSAWGGGAEPLERYFVCGC